MGQMLHLVIETAEPENNLSPFYLSRIIQQVQEIAAGRNAQAIVSSHSPSILARLEPSSVRHFRLDLRSRCSEVKQIRLPANSGDVSKFVREAVRAYPELYFARYVILGEGATEEIVLPLLSKAMGFPIDRSFVAVVPLGGRHVNHLWQLLNDLQVPYATLLDLDWGRSGGGFGRIKTVCEQLLSVGFKPEEVFGDQLSPEGPGQNLAEIATSDSSDKENLRGWIKWLEQFQVYFSVPLDLDYSMLMAYPEAYRVLEDGMRGPSDNGDPRKAVLGENGNPDYYEDDKVDALRWYRYLFLGRGKPSTHFRVLSRTSRADLVDKIPHPFQGMLTKIHVVIEGDGTR